MFEEFFDVLLYILVALLVFLLGVKFFEVVDVEKAKADNATKHEYRIQCFTGDKYLIYDGYVNKYVIGSNTISFKNEKEKDIVIVNSTCNIEKL